ncbi:MAG: hemolysin III family protein [Bacteroidia bacterium]|nr:hemolysin III family protein [Bacteroidia bacterium]
MTINEMKENLKSQPMPEYTHGEETFNWLSHAIGIVIGLVYLGYSLTMSFLMHYSAWQVTALIISALSVIFLYSVSTTYHVLPKNSTLKKLFRLLDHNTIYLLIAGTYAPICAFAFQGTPYGWIIMGVELVGLVIGTVMNVLNLNGKATQIITVVLYVVMGWLIVAFYPIMTSLPFPFLMLILFGGISYTLGVIFYALGKKVKWMHGVFHCFVLLGTILQLVGIILITM